MRRKTGRREEITSYEGLPVTTVARTIADVALAGLSDELVAQAVQEAVAQGLALPEDLERAAARGAAAWHRLFARRWSWPDNVLGVC